MHYLGIFHCSATQSFVLRFNEAKHPFLPSHQFLKLYHRYPSMIIPEKTSPPGYFGDDNASTSFPGDETHGTTQNQPDHFNASHRPPFFHDPSDITLTPSPPHNSSSEDFNYYPTQSKKDFDDSDASLVHNVADAGRSGNYHDLGRSDIYSSP